MCECLEEEIEELKAELKREADRTTSWMRLWCLNVDTVSELRASLSNTKAELSGVRLDLADTTTTLDRYRDMHVNMSRANSDLRKSVADLEDTIRTLTEERNLATHVKSIRANSDLGESFSGIWVSDSDREDTIRTLTGDRDLAREMYQGVCSKYAELLDRHSKMCVDYDGLVSRYDDLLLHCDAEHGKF